ncbi:MAG: IPT/TIG domain-containing protein [Pseudomonadota bacterium]
MHRHVAWLVVLGVLGAAGCEPPPDPPPPPLPPPAPSLIAISPSIGLTSGADTVTLAGANLANVTTVAFGTAAASIESATASELVVISPPAARGVVSIKATSSAGTGELLDAFTYQQAVTISGISPFAIPANAATTLTINGSGFVVDAIDPVVRVGTQQLALISSSDTAIEAQLPALTVGSYDVLVRNGDNREAVLPAGLTVRDPVVVSGVTPNWAFMNQTRQVTIIGSAFDGAVAVLFGGNDAVTYTVVNSTTITATVPVASTAGSVDVVVRRAPGDEGMLAGGFTYYSSTDTTLRILDVNPRIGRNAGGTQVEITGTGFDSLVTIQFAGTEAAIDQVTSTSIRVQTPPYALAGTLVSEPVAVTAHRQADVATLENGFTYYRVPVITQVTPTVLPSAGGDTVTVNGEGFTIGSTQVFFGNMAATNVIVTNQAELTCNAPPHPEGEDIPVTVQTEFETSAEWVGVAFREFTRIQTVTPSILSKAGRTFITVVGTGFAEAINMTVTIDGNPVDDLQRDQVDLHILTFRSRGPMNEGQKTLLVRNNETGQEDTEVLQVVDPTDKDAVHGGGPIAHNLSITVIRDDDLTRLRNAVVFAGDDGNVTEGSYNKGVTDVNGMTVLSGDKVLQGPLMITVGATDFETTSIIGLNAQNVTVLLTPKNPNAQPYDHGVISGTVTGWSNAGLPTGNPANRYYRVAQVVPSHSDILNGNYPPGIESWAIEIRSDQATCSLVLPDGTATVLGDASYSVNSSPGVHAVIASVAFWDSVDGVCGNQPVSGTAQCQQQGNQNCEGWLGSAWYDGFGFFIWGTIGATYGITTDINVQGGGGATGGNNINLDVPAVAFNASINSNPTYLGANGTAYTADAYLHTGNSGNFVFLGQLKGDGSGINFGPVPLLRGAWTYTVRGYVSAPVVDGNTIVDFTTPTANSFVRNLTSMSPPMLSTWVFFPQFTSSSFQNGTTQSPTEGRFTFARSGGATPDMTIISVYDSGNDSFTPLWTVIVRGDPRTITLPELGGETRIDNIPTGNHFWTLFQLKVDNFDFDDHTARDRTTLTWRAGTQSDSQILDKVN